MPNFRQEQFSGQNPYEVSQDILRRVEVLENALQVEQLTDKYRFFRSIAISKDVGRFRIEEKDSLPTKSDVGELTFYDGSLYQSPVADQWTQVGGNNSLFTQTADKTVANTSTETTLLGTGEGSKTLPADFLTVGKTIYIRVSGYWSDISSPGTGEARVKIGGTTILDTTAQTPAGSVSNKTFEIDGFITCRTTGASGTIHHQGYLLLDVGGQSLEFWGMPATSTTTVDTTSSLAIDVTWQWSTADAGNTMTATNATIQVIS